MRERERERLGSNRGNARVVDKESRKRPIQHSLLVESDEERSPLLRRAAEEEDAIK